MTAKPKTLPLAADRRAALAAELRKGPRKSSELQERFPDWYAGGTTQYQRMYSDLKDLGARKAGNGERAAWYSDETPKFVEPVAPKVEPVTPKAEPVTLEPEVRPEEDLDEDDEDDEDEPDEPDIIDAEGQALPDVEHLPSWFLARCIAEARRRVLDLDELKAALLGKAA